MAHRRLPPNTCLRSFLKLQYERSLVIPFQPVIINCLPAILFVCERSASRSSWNAGPCCLLKVIIQTGVFLTLEDNTGSFIARLGMASSCIVDMSSLAVRTTRAVLCWSPDGRAIKNHHSQSKTHQSGLKHTASAPLLLCSFVLGYSGFTFLRFLSVNSSCKRFFLIIKAVVFEIITGLPELGSVVKNTKDLLCCCCYWVNGNLNVRTEVGCYCILRGS